MRDKKTIRQDVKSQTDSITRIISPEDLVHQDINDWENADLDRLKEELAESMSEWHYQSKHPFEKSIKDLALILYRENMVRVPFDHLTFESRDKAVRKGYWLREMSVNMVNEKIRVNWDSIEHMHEFEQEAQMEIEGWILEAKVEEIA